MAKYSFLIVMAIYVIYHVVTGLVQESAKKQRQDGLEAQGRAPRAAGTGQARTQLQAGPAAIREARIDDLSARRRSQLDQLRARRESRRTIQPAELRVGGPAAAPRTTRPALPPGLPPTTPRTIPPVQPRREELRAAQRAERLQRVERGLAAAKRPGVEPPKLDIEPIRKPPGRIAQESRAAYATGPRRRGGRAGRLLSQLNNSASLRDLFVLKEVLDPPVAMRGPDTLGSSR